MKRGNLLQVETMALPFLLSVPEQENAGKKEKWPVLCFLHGLGEGPPTEIRAGVTAHGPLRTGSSPLATANFIVAAPQLPARGDIWRFYADAVYDIVAHVQQSYGGNPRQTYLTGFSFGADGVLDLAVRNPAPWAALWPVDPTRAPESDPGLPVWLWAGQAARPCLTRYIQRLRLSPPATGLRGAALHGRGARPRGDGNLRLPQRQGL